MVTQFDEKGKIFTQVVNKEPVLVTIQTLQHLIRGTIHLRPGERLKDDLNEQERFLAVTDAILLNPQKEEVYRTSFLAVNVAHIVWVIPDEEVIR
jgi:hypothetical protein